MSRINTNVNSLIAQRILTKNNADLTKTLERLSTGFRINRGADDPAGLISSEKLRAEKEGLSAAIGNAQRAEQIANIAEGGLQEISSLLTELQGLVGQTANDAGLSTEEKEANQQQVDAILQTIDRISSVTNFQGSKLLNGNFDFTVSSVAATVNDFKIRGATIGDSSVDVKAIVTASAQHAGLYLSTGGALNLTDADSRLTFELAGTLGSKEFSFASGTTQADIVATVNTFKSVTGVSAATQGTGVVFKTPDFGSAESVGIKIVSDGGLTGFVVALSSIDEDVVSTTAGNRTAVASVTSLVKDQGQDVEAIINGITARGEGKVASVNTDTLNLELEFTTAGATAAATISALTITGGGAKFNLGQTVNVGNQVRLGLPNVAARHLGSKSLGYLDDLGSGKANNLVDGDLEDAQKIVTKAIDQVTALRGQIGAFQNFTVGSTINALNVALENTSAAESLIRDTDFATETANLTRSQILVSAANQVLSISNNAPSAVLSLLG